MPRSARRPEAIRPQAGAASDLQRLRDPSRHDLVSLQRLALAMEDLLEGDADREAVPGAHFRSILLNAAGVLARLDGRGAGSGEAEWPKAQSAGPQPAVRGFPSAC